MTPAILYLEVNEMLQMTYYNKGFELETHWTDTLTELTVRSCR